VEQDSVGGLHRSRDTAKRPKSLVGIRIVAPEGSADDVSLCREANGGADRRYPQRGADCTGGPAGRE
jgi:hypothetical protein